MTEYAVSTNLISWAPAHAPEPFFGWPQDGPEAQVVSLMVPGDLIIPKFSQNPEYRRGGGQVDYQRGVCEVLGLNHQEQLAAYGQKVNWGNGAVPFVWRVVAKLPNDDRLPSEAAWSCVAIAPEELPYPLSTREFLLLRVVPVELARQFKATAAFGRHIQEVPAGTASAIRAYTKTPDRKTAPDALRRLSLVRAESRTEAEEKLATGGRKVLQGDLAFLALDDRLPGLYAANTYTTLSHVGEVIHHAPAELHALFIKAKARSGAGFRASNALSAANELAEFLGSGDDVKAVDDFAYFHDRYSTLPSKVNQALEIVSQPTPPPEPGQPEEQDDPLDPRDEEEVVEQDELEALLGLVVVACGHPRADEMREDLAVAR